MPSLSQSYEIVNVNSGKALDVSGSSTADGAAVIQFTYHNGPNQQWYFKLVGTSNEQEVYQIVNVNSGKVLDVSGGSTADNALIEQWEQNGGRNQQWYLSPVGLVNWLECYQIISVNSNKALGVVNSSVADDVEVQQASAATETSQQWLLYPVASLDQTPRLAIETKYMQNYRASSPVNGSKELAAVCDTHGQTELFTVGSDGNVTVFSADTTSETGYSGTQLTTNVKAVSLAAGLDSQGQVTVFAVGEPGPKLYYLVKTFSSTSTQASWAAPSPFFSIAVPDGAKDIARVIARTVAGSLYVALLWSMNESPYYKLTYGTWQAEASTFVSPADDPNFSTLDGFWLGSTAQNLTFASFSKGKIYLHALATGQTTYATTSPDRDIVSVDAVTDAAGNDHIFAILDDKNAYQLSLPSAGTGINPAYTWGQCSQGVAFQQIATEVNSQGQPQIFAVSDPMSIAGDGSELFNVLYHWNNADAPMPASIAKGTGLYLGTVGNEQGDLDLFTVDSQNHVTHLFQEQESENWTLETVEVQAGPIEEFCSYATDITVYDPAGALAVGSPLTVWASEEARITVNGQTFFIDPYRAGQIATNSAGMVSITQEATALAVPSLQINFSEFMQPGESVVIQQFAGVQNRLATVTSDDLMNATVADGSYLLAEKDRTLQNTQDMATALNQCMALVGTPLLASTSSPYLHKKGQKHGVWLRPSGSAADLRKVAHHPKHVPSWQLSLKGNVAHYRELTPHQAQDVIAKEKANPQLGGAFDWVDDIGDFFEGVVDEVIDVTNVIVSTVADGVEAVISFVIDNVPYVFDAIITVIDQAFDLVQTIFAAFLIPYELLFQWLAELFGWNDILRTKQALAYTINQCLGFFEGAAPGLQTLIDSNMGQLQEQLTSLFDYADQNIAGQSTIGGYEQSNAVVNTIFDYAFSNNFLYNKVIDNLASAIGSPPLTNNSSLNQLSQQCTAFANLLEGTSAYGDASAFFQLLGSGPDQIFTQLLATLFQIAEEFLQEALSAVRGLVDAVFQAIPTIVANLRSVFNTPWNIPFVSEFYSFITEGGQLTTLDLVCLLLAIPVNLYYKAAGWGDAPFTDDGGLTAFQNAFNAQLMIQTSGLMGQGGLMSSGSDSDQPAISLTKEQKQFVIAGYSCATALNGTLSAILDRIPPGVSEPYGTILSLLNYIAIFGGVACRYEGFFTKADLSLVEAAGLNNLTYYVAGGVALAVAGVALAYRYYPENWIRPSDIKAGLFTIGGCVMLEVTIYALFMGSDESAEQISWRVLQPIPWIAKFLRITGIQTPVTLRVLAGIDMVFNYAVAELGFWVLA